MAEDTRLVNIYLKIHNKQPLFLDDLRYLAKYDPECFEKTCRNVVYNIPETKPIMEPVVEKKKETEPKPNIEELLDNLKYLEKAKFPVPDLDAEKVKNLLGNLFMEQIFPHNDKDTFMELQLGRKTSFFDKKA